MGRPSKGARRCLSVRAPLNQAEVYERRADELGIEISGTTGCSSWRAPRTSTFLTTSSRSWIRSDSASTTPAMHFIGRRLLATRPTANFRFQHELALDSEKPPLLCRPEGVLRFDFSPGKRLATSLSELHLLKSRGLMAILTKSRAHSPSLATSVVEAIA